MSVSLTVSILSGDLAPDSWAEVEFATSDLPFNETSACGMLECGTVLIILL